MLSLFEVCCTQHTRHSLYSPFHLLLSLRRVVMRVNALHTLEQTSARRIVRSQEAVQSPYKSRKPDDSDVTERERFAAAWRLVQAGCDTFLPVTCKVMCSEERGDRLHCAPCDYTTWRMQRSPADSHLSRALFVHVMKLNEPLSHSAFSRRDNTCVHCARICSPLTTSRTATHSKLRVI